MRFSYITDVLETLILRDIRQKYRIRNAEQLKRSCEFLMDNVGNISSLKGMAAELSRANLKISDKTLAVYIDYLCNAFAFYRFRRFDVSGKKYLSTGDKYYLADHSFRYAELGTKKLDPLRRIRDAYPKCVIARTGHETTDWDGIKVVDLARWLMGESGDLAV